VETLLALAIGSLFAAGLYLALQRSLVALILGLALLGHGANLLVFTAGRVVAGRPPLVAAGAERLAAGAADPVPQALVLTAIVIGFGVQAFLLVLLKRAWAELGTEDLDALRTTDADEEGA